MARFSPSCRLAALALSCSLVVPSASNLRGRKAYRTCSLVSTAGVLLQEQLGAEIDAADAVFRLSLSPVRGFEAHVGRRTTGRIFRPSMFEKSRGIPLDQAHALVDEASQVYWMLEKWEEGSADQDISAFQRQHPGADFERWRVPEGAWKCTSGRQPSSGFSAAHKLLQEVCESVSLFGFHTPPAQEQTAPYHYFDVALAQTTGDVLNISTRAMFDKKEKAGGHSFRSEHRLLLSCNDPPLPWDTPELVVRARNFAAMQAACKAAEGVEVS